MPEPATLAALKRAAPLLSVSAVAEAAEMDRQTLHTRLRRGSPELTAEESAKVADALRAAGLALV